MASRKRSISKDEDMRALYKEWDEVSCPICMEHPHNAVLLLCSSHDKGCRSYICDTSYRHSNCLDRFRRLKAESGETPSPPSLLSRNQHDATNISGSNLGFSSSNELIGSHENHEVTETVIATSMGLPGGSGGSAEDSMLERVGGEESNVENSSEVKLSLRCPLCRGSVLGWKVVEEARKYLNLKPRSCSRESCSFFSNYRELRRHARRVHPTARPAEIHPSRQRAWRRLEDQREYDDIVSAIRSAMPGAIVLGDYVIENGDRLSSERERGPGDNGRWLSTFFLFQMIGSMDRGAELRGGRSRALSRHRRSTGAFSRRRYLWGENLLGLQDEDNDDDDDEDEDEDEDDDDDDDDEDDDEPDLNILSDMVENDSSLNPRRRRRLTRSRLDEDQP